MKITENYLKQIILEEIEKVKQTYPPIATIDKDGVIHSDGVGSFEYNDQTKLFVSKEDGKSYNYEMLINRIA